jgi:hypothetical protein
MVTIPQLRQVLDATGDDVGWIEGEEFIAPAEPSLPPSPRMGR